MSRQSPTFVYVGTCILIVNFIICNPAYSPVQTNLGYRIVFCEPSVIARSVLYVCVAPG